MPVIQRGDRALIAGDDAFEKRDIRARVFGRLPAEAFHGAGFYRILTQERVRRS